MKAVVWTKKHSSHEYTDHYRIVDDIDEADDLFHALKEEADTHCAAITDVVDAMDPHWTD